MEQCSFLPWLPFPLPANPAGTPSPREAHGSLHAAAPRAELGEGGAMPVGEQGIIGSGSYGTDNFPA